MLMPMILGMLLTSIISGRHQPVQPLKLFPSSAPAS
jgi:hypothetical protein